MIVKNTQTLNLFWHLGSSVQPSLKHSKVCLTRVATQICHSFCCQIQQMMIATAKSEQGAQTNADLFLSPSPAARSDFGVWGITVSAFSLLAPERSWATEVLLQRYREDFRTGDPSLESIFMICSLFFFYSLIFFAWLLFFCQRKLVHHSPEMR